MKVIRGLENLNQPLQGTVVTLGNFDGVHRGHQYLLSRVLERRPPGGVAVVMTFDPHPLEVLHPERPLARLTDQEEMIEQIEAQGVDILVIQPFHRDFANLSAQAFFEDWIVKFLHPERIVVGYDFAFGKDRQGDFSVLKKMGEALGIPCETVEPFRLNQEIVSSRGLRDLIKQGELKKARSWLGRDFRLSGTVVSGAGRGRGLGFATMNVEPTTPLLPKEGVYATRALAQGRLFESVTNVGSAPTFEANRSVRVECHVLDADLNAYGEKVKIEFVERIRDELKFSSGDALKTQIAQDVKQARKILGTAR